MNSFFRYLDYTTKKEWLWMATQCCNITIKRINYPFARWISYQPTFAVGKKFIDKNWKTFWSICGVSGHKKRGGIFKAGWHTHILIIMFKCLFLNHLFKIWSTIKVFTQPPCLSNMHTVKIITFIVWSCQLTDTYSNHHWKFVIKNVKSWINNGTTQYS